MTWDWSLISYTYSLQKLEPKKTTVLSTRTSYVVNFKNFNILTKEMLTLITYTINRTQREVFVL